MPHYTAAQRNARLGLRLFYLYAACYLAFVLVNALAASWMEWVPIAGLNLAVLWGFGLIILAVVLALIYGLVCQKEEVDSQQSLDSKSRDLHHSNEPNANQQDDRGPLNRDGSR